MTVEATAPTITVEVDGKEVLMEQGTSVLDACRESGADIPTLCHGPNMTPANACRVCVVELEGARTLIPSCSRRLEEGMKIRTSSDRAAHSRRLVMELLGSASEIDRTDRPLDRWMQEAGADPHRFGSPSGETPRGDPRPGHHHLSDTAEAASVAEPVKIEDDLYVRDYSRCILCYRCVDACGVEHQNTYAISVVGRGFDSRISTEFDAPLPDSACVYCGNCIAVCPTGALVGKTEYDMRETGTWAEERQEVTRTVCSYCGVGCNLDLHTQDGRIVKVTSPHDHDVTLGNLCIKGRFGWQYVTSGVDG
ncbi:MAG: 2Fe-2S iron-sulfur cluster-binding protein [Acidimicrobiia bacterium]